MAVWLYLSMWRQEVWGLGFGFVGYGMVLFPQTTQRHEEKNMTLTFVMILNHDNAPKPRHFNKTMTS